jgi:hypothetical protein
MLHRPPRTVFYALADVRPLTLTALAGLSALATNAILQLMLARLVGLRCLWC